VLDGAPDRPRRRSPRGAEHDAGAGRRRLSHPFCETRARDRGHGGSRDAPGHPPAGISAMKLTALVALATSLAAGCEHSSTADIDKVDHIIVIFMENHSFDNLYGVFPGTDGVANAAARPKQA